MQAIFSISGNALRCGISQTSGMRNVWLANRLDELRRKGKSRSGLARHLGIQPSRITEIISGDREISTSELPKIAEYLELDQLLVLAYATGANLRPVHIKTALVKGAVQAGVWREALEWPQDDWRPSPVAPDGRFDRVEQFGLEVRGPSMNEVYPDGSVVICVKFLDINRDPAPGDHVVVLRSSTEGVEATLKELQKDAAGELWLWPRSTDPNFQQPWPLDQSIDDRGREIRIFALVIGSYVPRPIP